MRVPVNFSPRSRLILAGALALVVACAAAVTSAHAVWSPYKLPRGNVVLNPGAELPGPSSEARMGPWVSTPWPSWGQPEYVAQADLCQGPNDPRRDTGSCYLDGVTDPTGGKLGRHYWMSPADPGAQTAVQDMRLSTAAYQAIGDRSTGWVQARLDAWIGGWGNERSYGGVVVQFQSASGSQLGRTVATEPVDKNSRGGKSTLIHRTETISVPAGTRTIRVTMKAIAGGENTHGVVFDNISLVLEYALLTRDDVKSLMTKRIATETRSGGCAKLTLPLQLSVVDPRLQGKVWRAQASIGQWDGNDHVAEGQAVWLVRTKEDIRPQNPLARYIDGGCPGPNPPGMIR